VLEIFDCGRCAFEQFRQPALSFLEGVRSQVLTIDVEQIEGEVDERGCTSRVPRGGQLIE
jgi:hypothetical protein